ncbi:unnamed protein product, partial [Rotaria sp. Silwood1]
IIDLIDDADESAIKIFANARQFLLDKGLDMHGLTVLGADNTNVNVGHNHSVYSLFKDEVPDILKGTNENIEALTWNQVIQFVDMLKIKDLNEDCLFDEFTNIKLIFKTISDQSVPIFNQVQAFRSRMTTELISAELKIRLNSTLSCTELYKYILSSEYLLRAIKSNEKYTFKRKCVQ